MIGKSSHCWGFIYDSWIKMISSQKPRKQLTHNPNPDNHAPRFTQLFTTPLQKNATNSPTHTFAKERISLRKSPLYAVASSTGHPEIFLVDALDLLVLNKSRHQLLDTPLCHGLPCSSQVEFKGKTAPNSKTQCLAGAGRTSSHEKPGGVGRKGSAPIHTNRPLGVSQGPNHARQYD